MHFGRVRVRLKLSTVLRDSEIVPECCWYYV